MHRTLGLVIVLAAVAFAGCRSWPEVSTQVRNFDETAKPPLRVVLFPPVCRGTDGGCEQADIGGVSGRLASELELLGYTVIDGAELVASARSRETAGAELRLFGEQVASASGIHQAGSLFVDLPPAVRRQVLEEANAQGIVRVHILFSARDRSYPLYGVRSLEMQARLGLGVDESPVWTARCSGVWVTNVTFIGDPGRNYGQGLEEAARCVANAALADAGQRRSQENNVDRF